MSELQPSPDLQALFDRLDTAHDRPLPPTAYATWQVAIAKPVIERWSEAHDLALMMNHRPTMELTGPAVENVVKPLVAERDAALALVQQRDEEVAALREENERLGEQNQGLYAALLIIGKERDGLAAENERLRAEVSNANARNHERNLQLDALHFVWCDGGCPGGVHRFDGQPFSEDVVITVELAAKRLRRWWTSAQAKGNVDV